MNINVPLDVYLRLAELARLRNTNKEQFNKYSEWRNEMDRRGKQTSEFNHLAGLLGEWCAGQVLGGAPVDSVIWTDSRGDQDHADLYLADGRRASVKTRAMMHWDFALGSADPGEFKADIGVLVWPANHFCSNALRDGSADELHSMAGAGALSLNVYGYATRERFLSGAVRVNYLRRAGQDRLALSWELLTPLTRIYAPNEIGELV